MQSRKRPVADNHSFGRRSLFARNQYSRVPLLENCFRANEDYELVLQERFVRSGAAALGNPEPNASVYGYLLPTPSSSLVCREVSPDTALLFQTLRHPGPVPAYFRALFGTSTETRLLRLLVDSVLEVAHEGSFVSGPRARELLFRQKSYSGSGPIGALSIEALRYVEALGGLTVQQTTTRLYGFGRRPMTPAQKRAFPDSKSNGLSGFLGPAPSALGAYWALSQSANPYWTMWRPIWNNDNTEPVRFKLYISPGLNDIAETFKASAGVLGQSVGVRGLKLGRGLPGLTRPDKLIAYFSRIDDLQEAGLRLYSQVHGSSVHGVPFTAEFSPDGLLSWGADPPPSPAGWTKSWRMWLAGKLATHFEAARLSNAPIPLWRFVLDRLRLDGVNPDTWMPAADLWPPTGAT